MDSKGNLSLALKASFVFLVLVGVPMYCESSGKDFFYCQHQSLQEFFDPSDGEEIASYVRYSNIDRNQDAIMNSAASGTASDVLVFSTRL